MSQSFSGTDDQEGGNHSEKMEVESDNVTQPKVEDTNFGGHETKSGIHPHDGEKITNDDEEEKLPFTSLSVPMLVNQKNYIADYLKKDDQSFVYRRVTGEIKGKNDGGEGARGIDEDINMEDEENDEDVPAQSGKKIIIHLGSRSLRIGLSNDTFPKTIPTCIARRFEDVKLYQERLKQSLKQDRDDEDLGDEISADERDGFSVAKAVEVLETEVKARMRIAKRRTIPNAYDQTTTYNSRVVPEVVQDHNDPYRVEWTDTAEKPKFITGQKALLTSDPNYLLFWPIKYGLPNESEYITRNDLMADIQDILEDAILNELGVPRKEWRDSSAILILPDDHDRVFSEELVAMLLKGMSFAKFMLLQESLCTSFGAGISTACVVDIGAQSTKISCVDEGQVVPDSRITLNIGGDDVTFLLTELLLNSAFPYHDVDLSVTRDWLLMEDLKQRICTLSETHVASQVVEFYVRRPDKKTLRYSVKTYAEPFEASLV